MVWTGQVSETDLKFRSVTAGGISSEEPVQPVLVFRLFRTPEWKTGTRSDHRSASPHVQVMVSKFRRIKWPVVSKFPVAAKFNGVRHLPARIHYACCFGARCSD